MHLARRQIHLDFHTSPLVPDVGGRFDADRFAGTLTDAGVDSVTCFARCHHGMLYYPTRWRPDLVHPNLRVADLLNRQVEACHRRGIRVPVYTTVQWDQWAMEHHPEWLCLGPDGKLLGREPTGPGFYARLDVFHDGYRAFLREHVADLVACVPDLDGLFFDITHPTPSLAPHWKQAYDEAGVDAEDAAARQAFAEEVMDDWQREMTGYVRSLAGWRDDMTVFYNAGHVGPRHRAAADTYTHFEVESLPSGAWGYLHFPLAQSYARTLGAPTLGMTGKFHTAWGDFHSYKTDAALEFEVLRTVAHAAAVSVGDQLPPDGVLDGPTYENVSRVFRRVGDMAGMLDGADVVREVAVLTPEAFAREIGRGAQSVRQHDSDSGVVRMLTEGRRMFDRVDATCDFGRYRVVVLPDNVPVGRELAGRLADFVGGGGVLLGSGDVGEAAVPFGVEVLGDSEWEPGFLLPRGDFASGLPRSPHVMYERGTRVRVTEGEVLADELRPHFNRTWRHYCGHRHAPTSGEVAGPAVVRNSRCVYFSHRVFGLYHRVGPRWVRELVLSALDGVCPPLMTVSGPVGLNAVLNERRDGGFVLHLLYYPAERKAAGDGRSDGGASASGFDVIEEFVPLSDVEVTLALPKRVTSARVAGTGERLGVTERDGRQVVVLPRLDGHAAVELGVT